MTDLAAHPGDACYVISAKASPIVVPAKAGIQSADGPDPGFRRGDAEWSAR